MRPVQAEAGEGLREGGDGGVQRVGGARREGRGVAETGQVDGDDLAFGGEQVHDGRPALATVADAVQQDEGRPSPWRSKTMSTAAG